MIRWISVNEFLPPFDILVMVFLKDVTDICTAYLEHDENGVRWKKWEGKDISLELVKYWCKINIPEEGKENE